MAWYRRARALPRRPVAVASSWDADCSRRWSGGGTAAAAEDVAVTFRRGCWKGSIMRDDGDNDDEKKEEEERNETKGKEWKKRGEKKKEDEEEKKNKMTRRNKIFHLEAPNLVVRFEETLFHIHTMW